MIIDVHVHILKMKQLKQLRIEMRKSGVDKVIIMDWASAVFPKNFPSLEDLLPVAPKDMFFMVSLGSSELEKGVERVEHFLQNKRVVGIKLYPGYDYFYPNEKRMFPIYEIAKKYRVPVLFHSGETWDKMKKAKLKYSRALWIDEIATIFPKVKFIISHLSYPNFSEALEVLEKNENVYADTSDILGYDDKKYGKKSFEWIKSEIEKIVYTLGSAKKILYGSDWPIIEISMKEYIERVNALDISKRDKKLIFYRNAIRIFKRLC